MINHHKEGLLLVCSPSQNFEKNAENLKPEKAEGFKLIKLRRQEAKEDQDFSIEGIEWSEEQEKDLDNPHIDRSQ